MHEFRLLSLIYIFIKAKVGRGLELMVGEEKLIEKQNRLKLAEIKYILCFLRGVWYHLKL